MHVEQVINVHRQQVVLLVVQVNTLPRLLALPIAILVTQAIMPILM